MNSHQAFARTLAAALGQPVRHAGSARLARAIIEYPGPIDDRERGGIPRTAKRVVVNCDECGEFLAERDSREDEDTE